MILPEAAFSTASLFLNVFKKKLQIQSKLIFIVSV